MREMSRGRGAGQEDGEETPLGEEEDWARLPRNQGRALQERGAFGEVR